MSNATGNQSATNVRRFKPYPAYKDTGVEWLGKVPEKWEIKRIRTILRDSDGIKIGPFGSSLKSEVIQATGYKVYGQEHVINGDFQLGEKYVDENKFNELCACEISAGDLVVSMMGTTGKCQIVPCDIERGIMDSHLLRIRPKATIHPQLLARLINESDYVRFQVSMNSKGSIMEGLNSSIIKNLALLLPSLDEQLIIETFLDRETARIDKLIAKKERQIELLQEKRAALISHAVTKGLNPKAKMKDSGIEWLGEIPEHWEVSKLGFHSIVKARLGWKGLKAEEYVDSGYIFLATPNIKGKKIDFINVNYITKERYAESPEIMLQKGDILLAKDGSTLGTVNVIRELPAPATVNSSVAVVRPKENVNSLYLYYSIASDYMQKLIEKMKGGQGVPHLFQDDIRKFWIWIPPILEQQTIVAHLERTIEKTESLILKVESSIGKLREYRTSLISAAVTGKIDVRQEVA